MKEKEVKLLDINMFVSIVFIFTVITSVLLTYNEKLILLGEKPLFDKDNARTITTINRFILLIIAIVYVYTGYQEYKINQLSNKKNKEKTAFINFIINDIQLILVIVVGLLPLIYPNDKEESNIIIP